MEHDVAGRDESSESSTVHDVIVCYDLFNSLLTCRWTDRHQIAPDFPNPIFSATCKFTSCKFASLCLVSLQLASLHLGSLQLASLLLANLQLASLHLGSLQLASSHLVSLQVYVL
jgi:hypothetical protein